jgi:mannose-1-phosphate guanylyltransferase
LEYEMFNAVIMAGGRGERFWPRSRFHKPKQLQAIAGTETMLQVTVKRIKPLIPPERTYVITSQEIEAEVRSQLPELPEKNIISEPIGRNTAAAIGLAAVWIGRDDTSATMAVLPADHVIPDEEKFLTCLSSGKASAEKQETLVVFGIKPAGPETGYGYLKTGHKIGEENGIEIYHAEAFVEKPDPVQAKEFVESGRHYWNSGMFVWTYPAIMGAIKEYMPRLFEGLEKIRNAHSKNRRETIAEVYAELENVSIDYGVMEKAANRVMVKGDFRWDDVGSWLAMERIRQKDELGNVSQGKFVGIDTRDSIVVGDKPLIAAIGVSNMIIVATDDAVLVCPKEKAQEVKQMVRKLLDNGLREYVQ